MLPVLRVFINYKQKRIMSQFRACARSVRIHGWRQCSRESQAQPPGSRIVMRTLSGCGYDDFVMEYGNDFEVKSLCCWVLLSYLVFIDIMSVKYPSSLTNIVRQAGQFI